MVVGASNSTTNHIIKLKKKSITNLELGQIGDEDPAKRQIFHYRSQEQTQTIHGTLVPAVQGTFGIF